MSPHSFIIDASLPVAERFDIYPEIDPSEHFADKTYKGKVVIITGASRGIGKGLALIYAKAGASLILCGRSAETLDDVKQEVLRIDGEAEIASIVADVADIKQVEAVVKAGIDRFGKLDVVIANAAKVVPWNAPIGEQDPSAWWSGLELNLRGVHSLAHFTLPHLVKTEGYFIAVSSTAGMMRVANGSSYCVSKHAVNRFIEFVALEYPTVKAFAIHPGRIATDMCAESDFMPRHEMGLPTATIMYLTSGNADWLSGKFISAPWDLGEVREEWKEKIEKRSGLVSKLFIPT